MKRISRILIQLLFAVSFVNCSNPGSTPKMAAEAITANDLKEYMDYIAADEFLGRDTPSEELKTVAEYLALKAEKLGLKPILKNSTYFQEISLETYQMDEQTSYIQLTNGNNTDQFKLSRDFGIVGTVDTSISLQGQLVFLGYGLHAPDLNWDDLEGIDVEGKIALILDPDLPDEHRLRTNESGILLRRRSDTLIARGAIAVLKIINLKREESFAEFSYPFANPVRAVDPGSIPEDDSQKSIQSSVQAEIRHGMAASLMGVNMEDINSMFQRIKNGDQVPSGELAGSLNVSVIVERGKDVTRNVLAYIEGNDPELKEEYLIYGAHYDHVGAREGNIYNGANDNASGSVALLEIAEAMNLAKPDRSVIFAWFTGEEKGLWGSEYFVVNPPVPVDKISACINLDVLSGDDAKSIGVVGSTRLSSYLDSLLHVANDENVGVELDYAYETGSSNFFFFHSDHLPFNQYGIPAIWLFNGPEPNVHQPTDTPDNINYEKLKMATLLGFYTGIEIANCDVILPLDIQSEIISRGSHNLSFNWREVIGN